MNLKKMMMASALLMVACCMQAQTKVIAHRGFWKTPGSSQNSISSLLKADSIGCYGSEFDVWIAKDNKLVVNHDPVYKMRPMEYSKGDALTGLKLSNGENLPSLEQYLEAGKNCNTRLILELKAHSNKKRETKAVQGILAMVKKMGLENRMEYITFSLHAMKEFTILYPGIFIRTSKRSYDLKSLSGTGPGSILIEAVIHIITPADLHIRIIIILYGTVDSMLTESPKSESRYQKQDF